MKEHIYKQPSRSAPNRDICEIAFIGTDGRVIAFPTSQKMLKKKRTCGKLKNCVEMECSLFQEQDEVLQYAACLTAVTNATE